MGPYAFTVYGVPAPKGSLTAFLPGWKPGQYNRPRPVLVEDHKRTKPWMASVRAAAKACRIPMFDGGVRVTLVFSMPRLKGHISASGYVKAGAPTSPIVKPDIDKLARTVLDALTGVAYKDDGQVVKVEAVKIYAAAPGVHIYIEEHRQ